MDEESRKLLDNAERLHNEAPNLYREDVNMLLLRVIALQLVRLNEHLEQTDKGPDYITSVFSSNLTDK